MCMSDGIGTIAAALAKAQGAMQNAIKDRDNPFYKSTYATLSSIWDAIRTPLSANGLAVVQTTELTDTGMVLRTTLMHASGEWIASVYPINPVKNDPQGLGSALTYARRYTLSALIGQQADEDDDGNDASGKTTPAPQVRKPAPRPPAPLQVDAPRPSDSARRPRSKELTANALRVMAEGNDTPMSAATKAAVIDALTAVIGGDKAQWTEFCSGALGITAGQKMTTGQANAIITWANVTTDSAGDQVPDMQSVAEAQAFLDQPAAGGD